MDFQVLVSIGRWLAVSIPTVGLVLSIIILARQASTLNRNLSYSAVHMLYNANIRISEIFIQHPGLRPYYYESKDYAHADGELRSQLHATSEAILDLFESVSVQMDMHRKDARFRPLKQHWRLYMQQMFETSACLRSYFDENESWYAQELRDIRKKAAHSVRTPEFQPTLLRRTA